MALSSLIIGQASKQGRGRPVNQDALAHSIPAHPALAARKGAIFIIADGMRAAPGGEFASRLAVRAVLDGYYASPLADPAQSLQAAIITAHNWLRYWSAVRPDMRGMGTTLTAVVVRGEELTIGHVGDSRAYLVRGGQAWPLTQDHTWVAEALTRGLLSPQEAAGHPLRHTLTRYLGGPSVTVDIRRVACRPGDRLVLCSDGVSDLLAPHEVGWLACHPPQKAARALVEAARQRGGRDDASAIVVLLGRPAQEYRPAVPVVPSVSRQPYFGGNVAQVFPIRQPGQSLFPFAFILGVSWVITLIAALALVR